ncbi:MAG: YigZ family protein [Halobacteriales archaeon]|nr:YigZ family protein [Halobacteriales archaeon]
MAAGAFRTVEGPGRAAFEIRGSRFIGVARSVRTVEEAEAFLEAVRRDHPDATHVVPAYRIRAEPLREWASDDGEPSGSAGKPALNVLVQRDLENVAVCVVRYYGGTNLGVGGLARAYGRATKEAVDDAGVTETQPEEHVTVTVAYDDSGTVRGIIESEGFELEAEYGEDVSFEAWVPVVEAADLRDRIRSATSGRAVFE